MFITIGVCGKELVGEHYTGVGVTVLHVLSNLGETKEVSMEIR